MNKIGIHYAYWQRDWNTDFAARLRHVAQLGFDAVDLATADIMALPREKAQDIKDCAALAGLSITQYLLMCHENYQHGKMNNN